MKKGIFVLFLAAMSLASISCQQPAKAANKDDVAEPTTVAEKIGSDVQEPATDNDFRPGMKVKVPTIIDFNATWCGPCRFFAPSFEKAATHYGNKMRFVSIDVDMYPNTANAFGIQSIPTIYILMPDGSVSKYIGLNDFLVGMKNTRNPSQEEIDNAIYENLTRIVDAKLAN